MPTCPARYSRPSTLFVSMVTKMVVVYSEDKGYWAPPGGGIEKGETVEEAVIREVREETNMKVLHQELIGY